MAQNKTLIWGTLDPFVESGPILGRKVANQGFLDALLLVDPFDAYHFFLPDLGSKKTLETYLQQKHAQVLAKVVLFPRSALATQLKTTTYHCFHLSDCLTNQGFLAALRNALCPHVFPITGVTHSLSYARYGLAFAQHLWQGTTDRDCIVATSLAGQQAVSGKLESLAQVVRGQGPQVRTIPLGIWPDEFSQAPQNICAPLPQNKIIFLVLGRISPYSKMDLLPLLRAFQRLGQQGVHLGSLGLVLAGSLEESSSLPTMLKDLAKNIGLELFIVPEPGDELKKAILHRADVVISLADNPQETFGLIVLEAAAAGKPIIISDYNGYRDLVIDQHTGLRIPTMDSGVEDEVSLMAPLLYDTDYHLWLAQDVSVDVGALTQAIDTLLDADQRKTMGNQAKLRAAEYAWPQIISKYCALWAELAQIPVSRPEHWIHPLALDYASVFQTYVTQRLNPKHVLQTTALGWAVYQQQDFPIVYAGLETRIDLELMRRILLWARKSMTWEQIYERNPSPQTRSTLMWMLKNDYLCLCS